MGGGLMQLVAYGAQDIYLTGNPQITFFKVVYRRHTNFSMEAIAQTFNGSAALAGRATATISRNGDLVHKMYVTTTLESASSGACANMGNTLIKEAELEIGGQRIDKHTGLWMETWAELTELNPLGSNGTVEGGMDAAGTFTNFQRMSASGGTTGAASIALGEVYIPLQFWFCRNPGLALPLIALQYHEVKVIFQFATAVELGNTSNTATNISLWVDYIYLDTDERRRFAQVSHEYLIEQVQSQDFTNTSSMDLNFNHPVKELIWVGFDASATVGAAASSATPSLIDVGKYKLILNGHDRFAERDITYFTRTQVYQHHSGNGGILVPDSIAVYSFALKPEEHQPSGTCNFSRIDNAQLKNASGAASNPTTIFAVNYNVLRIMSGMGGLAYSN